MSSATAASTMKRLVSRPRGLGSRRSASAVGRRQPTRARNRAASCSGSTLSWPWYAANVPAHQRSASSRVDSLSCTVSARRWSGRCSSSRDRTVYPAASRACQWARSAGSHSRNAQPSRSPAPMRPARPNICWTIDTSTRSSPRVVSRTITARAGRLTPAATVEVATRISASRARNACSASRLYGQSR
ncbi:hypothetical protein SCALM49S_07608 [Streptomyces californicus]